MSLWHAPRVDGDIDTARPGRAPGNSPCALPRCPYAVRGIDDDAVRACPGFRPAPLPFHGVGAGESIRPGETCAHLDVQASPRGYVSACTHPGGLPDGATELAGRLPRKLRAHPVR